MTSPTTLPGWEADIVRPDDQVQAQVSLHQLIRASAGSGKTFTLSGHFLQQLLDGAEPQSLLATTFTRKAAGEIQGRVLRRLAEAVVSESGRARFCQEMQLPDLTAQSLEELLQRLTAQLHRLRVSTLDSFFQQIARSLTLELGLPPGWSIVDDHADRMLRQRAVDAVLADQDTRDSRQLMQMLAKGRSQRSVRSLIDDAVSGYYELYLQTDFDAWNRIPESARLSREDQRDCMVQLEAIALDGKRLPAARTADLQRFREGDWHGFLAKGLGKVVSLGGTTYYRKELDAELIDLYQPLVRHAKGRILSEIAFRNQAAWNLISRFDQSYQQLRRDTGFTRFSEITRLLAHSDDAVDGRRVNYRLDSSLRHLLLDEFQDTSLDQWHVVRHLLGTILAPRPDEVSSVFCVGDPKQAIYGWRGGVAEIMDEVAAAVPGIQETTLEKSYRSSPVIMDAVNQVFTRLHQHKHLDDFGPAVHAWAQQFSEHSTARTDLTGYAELRTSPILEDQPDVDRKTLWYSWVADQIQEWHHQCPGLEIGVLMRTNGGVAQLVHQLTMRGVPASEEGGTPPTDSPAVLALMSVLNLASHPGCTVSRYHVALSPLSVPLNFANWDDDEAASRVAADLRGRLLDEGYGATLQWLADAVERSCSRRDQIRLQQVVAQGWRFDEMPSLDPAEFVRLLESSRFSRSAAAPVRVMTVHQSKGLEFDIVVVPELTGDLMQTPQAAAGSSRRPGNPEDVCVWLDKGLRHLLPRRLQQAFSQTVDDAVRGALCLLYVALTRAKRGLHLLIPPGTRTKSKTAAGILAAALSEDSELEDDAVIWSTGDPDWHHSVPAAQQPRIVPQARTRRDVPRIQLAPLAGGRRRGLARRAPSTHDGGVVVRAPSVGREVGPGMDPRTRGTLIHAWFEAVTWLDSHPLPEEVELRQVAQDLQVGELSLSSQDIDRQLPDFLRMLQLHSSQTALSEQVARAELAQLAGIERPAELELHVQPERPFAYRIDGTIVRGTIDRLVLARHRGRWVAADVLDFKTDRLAGETAAWVQTKVDEYGDQLRAYRTAVRYCFGIPGEQISTRLLLLEADMVADVQENTQSG